MAELPGSNSTSNFPLPSVNTTGVAGFPFTSISTESAKQSELKYRT